MKRKIKELKILEKNDRNHNEAQLKEYARSLKKYGQLKPVVINKDNEVLIGVGLCLAANMLGWEEVEVLEVNAQGIEGKKLKITDNKIFHLGTNNSDYISEVIEQIIGVGDYELIGWSEDYIKTISETMHKSIDEVIEDYNEQEREIGKEQIETSEKKEPEDKKISEEIKSVSADEVAVCALCKRPL